MNLISKELSKFPIGIPPFLKTEYSVACGSLSYNNIMMHPTFNIHTSASRPKIYSSLTQTCLMLDNSKLGPAAGQIKSCIPGFTRLIYTHPHRFVPSMPLESHCYYHCILSICWHCQSRALRHSHQTQVVVRSCSQFSLAAPLLDVNFRIRVFSSEHALPVRRVRRAKIRALGDHRRYNDK